MPPAQTVTAGPRIAACVKWVDTRPEIDPLTGHVHTDPRTHGASESDRAAVEVALGLAESWGGTVDLVTLGPAGADTMLRDLGAAGADRLIRVDLDPAVDSSRVGAALAAVLAGADLVVCGDHSLDRGSGSVPAFIAHHLGAAQCLGLTSIEESGPRRVRGTRRLGHGRAEVVEVAAPAVVSVEGAVASLRRASLSSVLAAERSPVDVVVPAPASPGAVEPGAEHVGPMRPPTRLVHAPDGDHARERILQLTGALVEHTPPRTIQVTPEEAAEEIVEQLRAWGYVE